MSHRIDDNFFSIKYLCYLIYSNFQIRIPIGDVLIEIGQIQNLVIAKSILPSSKLFATTSWVSVSFLITSIGQIK